MARIAPDSAPGPEERPLKVLFVHPSYPNTFSQVVEALAGRPGLQCSFLVENCSRAAVRAAAPRVSCFGFDLDGDDAAPLSYPPAGLFERGARRGAGVARALRALAPRWTFDVIVGSASAGCTLFLAGVTPAAVVSYCEQPNLAMKHARREFLPTFGQHLGDVSYQALVLTSVARSDLGMVASRHARSLFPPELRRKVRVQGEGFPPPADPGDRRAVRERLGLPPDAPLLGFCGRTLEAVRGFDVFLKVAREVRRARPDVQVLAIGAERTTYGNESVYLGPVSFKRFALQQAGMDESEVLWRGLLPYADFRACLACLDLAVLPLFEGASNWSFYEVMAAGVPLLASRRSYIPELVRDGREALLFDPYDVEGFAAAALRLLDDPHERERLGRAARERFLRRHTAERAADGYVKVIREAAALRRMHHPAGAGT